MFPTSVAKMGKLDYTEKGLTNFWRLLKSTMADMKWSQKHLIEQLESQGYTITTATLSRALSGKQYSPGGSLLLAVSQLKILKHPETQETFGLIDLVLICCEQINISNKEENSMELPKTYNQTTVGIFLDIAIEDLGEDESALIAGMTIDRLRYLAVVPEMPTMSECESIAKLLNEHAKKNKWTAEAIHDLYSSDAEKEGRHSANGSGLASG